MDVVALVYSVLLAIAGTAALIFVLRIPDEIRQRRLLQRFSQLQCGACHEPFGIEAVRSGEDVSPYEELWTDGKEDDIHRYPTLRLVECPNCHRKWKLRHNAQCKQFGEELSVNLPEAD